MMLFRKSLISPKGSIIKVEINKSTVNGRTFFVLQEGVAVQ